MRDISHQAAVLASVAMVLASTSVTHGLNEPSHEIINSQAVSASSLNQQLRDELGIPEGVDRLFRAHNEINSALRWIELGGTREDAGPRLGDIRGTNRYFRHFHDPLYQADGSGLGPWDRSGLFYLPLLTRFESSVHWAQRENQDSISGFGNFSWPDARRYFRTALTDPDPGIREQAFADTFRALGQVMHLIVDASVPEHVRNDVHPMGVVLDQLGQVGNYEYWVLAQHRKKGTEAAFIRDFLSQPIDFESALLGVPIPGSETIARAPIARLFDSDHYTGENPHVTAAPQIGIAEVANANFFSEDTRSGGYPHPSRANLERYIATYSKTGTTRAYYRKRGAGLSVQPIAVGCPLGELLGLVLLCPPDQDVWRETASHMLPRAVRYSQAVLDYFFRGKLDVDLVGADENDPSILRLVGTNASDDALVDGTLTLYADNPEGLRAEAVALDTTEIKDIGKDQPLPPLRFQAPEGAERFVAVYEGTLGQEIKDPARNFPGAVIGKVLGGVRVEEIFADFATDRWTLRTPQGVFLLPLTVTEFEDVKWGDAPNILVVRAAIDPAQPDKVVVAAYEVQRQPGSADVVTQATPAGPEVVLRRQAAVPFPLGLALGTTVALTHTIQWRQQLVKFESTQVFKFRRTDPNDPNKGFYEFDGFVSGPVDIDTVTNTFDFADTLTLVLDLDHHAQFSTDTVSYTWVLREVAVDPSGRLLGLVVVHPTFPPFFLRPRVEQTVFGLDTNGNRVPLEFCNLAGCRPRTVLLDREFPHGVNPLLSAVVDLATGQILGSTAEGNISIATSEVNEEVPNWFSPRSDPAPVVYVHRFTKREGGPNAGTDDHGWSGLGVQFRQGEPLQKLVELEIHEGSHITVTGWLRADLKQALEGAGLFTFGQFPATGGLAEYVLTSPQLGLGLRVTLTGEIVFLDAAQLQDIRRPRPASGRERVVFLAARAGSGEEGFSGGVLVWDPTIPRAQVLTTFPEGLHDLGPATGSTVLLSTFASSTLEQASLLLSLEGAHAPIVFPNEDLDRSFTLLDPRFLYNVDDMRFYRLTPPLTRTALPAPLAPVEGNPLGDYHAIRLP